MDGADDPRKGPERLEKNRCERWRAGARERSFEEPLELRFRVPEEAG